MADVGRHAGVHQTTVSLALRNDPRIPKATRERIAEIAKTLGYRPNPMVSALISERRRNSDPGRRSALAFMTASLNYGDWRQSRTYALLFEHLVRHAENLGYGLEEFWLEEPGMTSERMRSILLNRGIRGIIICPLQGERHCIDFDFTDFASIALGYTLQHPAVNLVASDYGANMSLAIAHLLERGHRRLLFLTTQHVNARVKHLSLERYLGERFQQPKKILAPLVREEFERESLLNDLRRLRPDAVIVPTGAEYTQTMGFLEEANIGRGKRVMLVNLDQRKNSNETGIIRMLDAEAAVAVASVTSNVERARFGLPESRQTILIPGRWMDGS